MRRYVERSCRSHGYSQLASIGDVADAAEILVVYVDADSLRWQGTTRDGVASS